MKIAAIVARILLGLLFTLVGAFGFVLVSGRCGSSWRSATVRI
jgi:hypothetical protein